jgi:hypothetical protein
MKKPLLLGLGLVSLYFLGKSTFNENILSPFGAHGNIKLKSYQTLADIGIKWVRLAGPHGLIFDEPQSLFKSHLNEAVNNGLNVIVTVKISTGRFPENIESYKNFLKNTVNTYKGKVKYYQIENEPAGGHFWKDSPQNYALLLREAYKTIKGVCPDCKVVIAGATSSKFSEADTLFFDAVFDTLRQFPDCSRSGCHDIFDLHTASCDVCSLPAIGGNCFSFMENVYSTAIDLQNKYGFTKPIWSTEFGFLRGTLEETQKSLIKSFVCALYVGYEKLFWRVAEDCCKIVDDYGFTGTYYAYRTLISKLQGFDSIEKISDSKFKFNISGKNPVYVFWSDYGTEPFEISGKAKVTDRLGNEQVLENETIFLNNEPVFIEFIT